MDAVITKSTQIILKNTMSELMALKLLVLAKRVLQTSPNIKINNERTDTQTDIKQESIGLNQVRKLQVLFTTTMFF